MKLATEPYTKVASGEKQIESRLYDKKRREVKIGDRIEFTEAANQENKVTVIVRGLLRYQTFKELFADHDPALFGEGDRETLLSHVNRFYTDRDQQKNGIIGIRFEIFTKQ